MFLLKKQMFKNRLKSSQIYNYYHYTNQSLEKKQKNESILTVKIITSIKIKIILDIWQTSINTLKIDRSKL